MERLEYHADDMSALADPTSIRIGLAILLGEF